MAIEYRDGSFSDIMSEEEAFVRFKTEMEEGVPVRALHVGSPNELVQEMERKELVNRLNELEKKIKALTPTTSSILDIPSAEVIKRFASKE